MIYQEVTKKAQDAAKRAAAEQMNRQGGDVGACGFAWVKYVRKHDGRTKAGREEVKMIKALGFKKDYDGNYMLWRPCGSPVQSVDVLHQGAVAYANVLKSYGITVYAQSRLD